MRAVTKLLWAWALGGMVVHAGPARAEERPSEALSYAVSPRFERDVLVGLKIQIDVTADQTGVTRLELPESWMGRTDLWRDIRDFTVEDATAITDDGPAVKVVRSRPGQRLVVRYELRSAIDHDPLETDGYPARPWVRPTWFYVDGQGVLVTVQGREGTPVQFRWSGWPKAFQLASNLEHGVGARDPGRSVLIGGRDVRIARSGGLRLALEGSFGASDAALVAQLKRILDAERGFWGEREGAPYLVTAASVAARTGSIFRGTGKDDAFAMVATPNMTLDDLQLLLAHEIFHAWNPVRLGRPIGPGGYWLSEGFTDFYARRLLQRARAISPAAFVDVWNEMLRDYDLSPAKGLRGADVAKAFWTDAHAEKVPYQRGALLAAIWDQRLRRRGSSLDAVLRAQAQAFTRRPDGTLVDLFAEQMNAAGVDVRADLRAFIEDGASLDLPPDLFAPCADVMLAQRAAFDLGFTPVMNDQDLMTVTSLQPNSPAYQAGLREGMVVVEKLAGTNGDTTRPYILRMRSADGAIQTLSFLPRGTGSASYRQLTLRPQAIDTPSLCDFRS